MRLGDGRKLGFLESGDPQGFPIVFFHGSPGSRLLVPPLPDGIRLITFDRPGYGLSTSKPDRLVGDCAPDVAALIDHLELDRVGLVAWSGGCPFGVATARVLGPKRVCALALVNGPGPLDEVPNAMDLLGAERSPLAELARTGQAERAKRRIVKRMVAFSDDPTLFLGSGRGPDREILSDPELRPMFEHQMREAIGNGAQGIAEDLVAMWLPFGFALADVGVPTHVFHGQLDPDNGEDVKAYSTRIPGASLITWPDLGHFGVFRRFAEVARAVVGSA